MIYKQGICTDCKNNQVIVNQKYKLCNYHNKKRLSAKNPRKPYFISKKSEKQRITKEKDIKFYQQCFYYSPQVCEECDIALGPEWNPYYVAHILAKNVAPEVRFDERNHFILCPEHHDQFDKGDKTKMKIYPIAEKIRKELHLEYNTKSQLNK